jgi:hypothetical protein
MNGSACLKLDGSSFDRRQPIDYPPQHYPKSLHIVSVPSLLPPQHGIESDDMEYKTAPRNLGSDWKEDLDDVRKALSSHWAKEVPGYKNAAKQVAPTIKASPATVESMRQNGLPEAMARMVFMCRHYPEFRAQFLRMVDPRYLLDPTQERVVHDMIMLMVRR